MEINSEETIKLEGSLGLDYKGSLGPSSSD